MMTKILGVRVDDISEEEALAKVSSWLGEPKKGLSLESRIIVTPGPEFLLTAQKDREFKDVLNKTDLSLPDGLGLQLYGGVKNRIPGRIFMMDLCREAAGHGWSIGFVGGWAGEGLKVRAKLEKDFPGIKIVAVVDGDEATKIKNGSGIDKYIKQDIDILFVGFGHPWQEKTLWKLKIENCKFRVGMGVGGAIDYLAGRFPEPPKFLQRLGLEWLWRLMTQPWRFARILKATFVFPLAVLGEKLLS